MRDRSSARATAATLAESSTHAAPPPSPADLAATEPLSARGLDALYRVETELAWGEL